MPPKLDKESTSNDKIFRLYSLFLFSKKEYSLTELAQIMVCTKQTILRLVESIETDKVMKIKKTMHGNKSFYKALLPSAILNGEIQKEELKQLLFCKTFFQNFFPANKDELTKYSPAITEKSTKIQTSQEGNVQEEFNLTPSTEKKPFKVSIRFFAPAMNYIANNTWSEDQVINKEENSIVLNFTAQSEFEVIKWLLSFGKDAELLAPTRLKNILINDLKKSLSFYE